jgi:TM2 domain-containing membrane protein YozV
MAMITCSECGKDVSDKAAYCPNCGAPISGAADGPPKNMVIEHPKSRGLAIILALLLGGLGVHLFYLNKVGWGIVFLLLSWTFIPLVLGVLQAIIWLFTSNEKFAKRYSTKAVLSSA